MAYTPTTWVNNSTPAINATNLNKMETGIDEAHECVNIAYTPFGDIVATNVQAAINELETEKESTTTSHASRHVTGGGDTIANAGAGGNAGLMTAADKTKLDAVEALADVTDTTNVAASGALMTTVYNAQTIVAATIDDTPVALGVGTSELVGRTAAGNVDSLTMAEARTILNVEDGADVTDATNVAAATAVMDGDFAAADEVMVGTGVGTHGQVTLAASQFLAKKAAGAATNVSATEARTILNVEDAADVTDAVNVASSIHGVAAKATPVNADEIGLIDSAAANVLKKLTWTNVKATLKTYFDSLYYIVGGTDVAITDGGTGASTAADGFTALKQAATSSATGVVELSIASEINTGTDTARANTPDALAGSIFGTKQVVVKVIADDTALTVADGLTHFTVPIELNGMDLISVGGHVYTVSSSGLPTFQIHNLTDAADMLSTAIAIDATEKDSKDAATPPVIDETHDDVATGDEIRFDCDVAGTGTKGMEIRMGFRLP